MLPEDYAPSVRLASILAKMARLVDWERRDRSAGGMRVDVDPMLDLLGRLGQPQRRFRSVHVAGTKGKGSVCALIEAGLRRAEIRVARFSSPHVERVTERITFGGVEIGEELLAEALERSWTAHECACRAGSPGTNASWFDVLTAAAFWSFAHTHMEWAVVECGIGGRLDSTNTIDAEVAVVTNIGLEHTAILGSSHAAIAREKVGILKPGATLITAVAPDSEAGGVLQDVGSSLGCAMAFVPTAAEMTIRETNVRLAGTVLDAIGHLQAFRKRSTAEEAPRPVGAWLLDEAAVRAAQLPGRMERFDVVPASLGTPAVDSRAASMPVILDGAHVPFNLAAVLRDLRRDDLLRGRRCMAVLGLGRDKDAAGMLRVLRKHAEAVVCTAHGHAPPAFGPDELCWLAERNGLAGEAVQDPEEALARAAALAGDDGWLFVTGSLHLAGRLRPLMRRCDVRPLASQLIGASRDVTALPRCRARIA